MKSTFDIPFHPAQSPGDVLDGVPLQDGAGGGKESSMWLIIGEIESYTWLSSKLNNRSPWSAVLALLPQVRGQGQVHALQPQAGHYVAHVLG